MYHFVRVTKKHFAEFVLDTAVKLLKEGNMPGNFRILCVFVCVVIVLCVRALCCLFAFF